MPGGFTLNEIKQKITNQIKYHLYPVLFLFIGFIAGCLFTEFFILEPGPNAIGKLDLRYNNQYARATETIGRLEVELARQRDINSRLRDYNNRARSLTGELTGTAERNVRNLQDAVSLIGEIRSKLQILAEFYSDSGSDDSNN